MKKHGIAAALIVGLWVGTGVAQDTSSASTAQEKPRTAAAAAPVQLKITVVIARYQGDKRIASLPYAFGVTTGERTNLRMGSEVPIASRVVSKTDNAPPAVNYRSVGTNIDCAANAAEGGAYKLLLTIEDSSVHLDAAQKAGSPAPINDLYPSFRSFRTSFVALLRDGQTTQHTSATDPVSGEVMRVDVTLNVQK